ncbi:phosphate ABC transporter permease subunit PstC [Enemella sp. A6]|uniref:phosphate ABC transporter permease subunit PstC n=1 Tax=Enemella sp. A6 TaxID=3440152 RepID=UPI003EBF4C9D
MTQTETPAPPQSSPGIVSRGGRAGDITFKTITMIAAAMILLTLVFVAFFLSVSSAEAFVTDPEDLIDGKTFVSWVIPLAIGTLIVSAIGLLLATPVAIGVALFISHLAPRRLSKPVGYIIDLLAAIPSVVYGAWGMTFFGPALVPFYQWLERNFGFIPLFSGPVSMAGRTILTAGIVLAVMVLPIITSLCREIFIQTPKLHEEAALALGATKWDMIKMAVFPFSRAGIVSAVMLGLGRALGETMAVAMVLSPGVLTANLIGVGNRTVPSEIALKYPEAFGAIRSELIAAGLVLFAITLIVNMTARWIVGRYSQYSGAN